MTLDEKYAIKTDPVDGIHVILSKVEFNNKTKENYLRPVAYFHNLASAIDYIIEMEIAGIDINNVKAVDEKIKSLQSEMHNLIDNYNSAVTC